jgi:hypothetical protein
LARRLHGCGGKGRQIDLFSGMLEPNNLMYKYDQKLLESGGR